MKGGGSHGVLTVGAHHHRLGTQGAEKVGAGSSEALGKKLSTKSETPANLNIST